MEERGREFMMAVESNPNQLKELFILLSDRKLRDVEVAPMVGRALLALDDPTAYVNDYPDDEWLVGSHDLEATQEGSIRLLHWILFDELQPWLTCGDKADEIAERVIDRLVEEGIVIQDPPRMPTLADYRGYLNEQLANVGGDRGVKQLVEFDTGLIDEVGLFVVGRNDVTRIMALALAYQLRIVVTAA